MDAHGEPQAAWQAEKENAGATPPPPLCQPATASASSGKQVAKHVSSGGSKRGPEEQAGTDAGIQGPSPAAKRQRLVSTTPAPSPPAAGADSRQRQGNDVTAEAQPQPQLQQQPDCEAQEQPACPPGNQCGAAAQAEAAQANAAALPDWCERPMMFAEDGQGEAFSYLPGHPLLALACEGHARLLAKVLCMGADPDARDSRGYTALHLACRHARLACVRCLLEAGATQVLDRQGHTPAEHAAAAGHSDVLAMLAHHEAMRAALAQRKQDDGPATDAADGGHEA